MKLWVVDTNVLLVAGEHHADISDACVSVCTKQLVEIKKTGRVALDTGRLILGEYENKGLGGKAKNAGQVFLKWLYQNQLNPKRCLRVAIVANPQRGFESFPEDPALTPFDPADRKFVAVAAACPGKPPILQAADAKWRDWAVALERHGIAVEFLCPDDVERFRERKRGKP